MRHVVRAAVSVGAVAAVTGVVFALRPIAPVLSLGVLYLFAVLPVAVLWGLAYALPVSLASLLAFNFFFLPPVHTLRLNDSENWVALAVYLFTAVVVSELAARSKRRAEEAEQREREAALLADVGAGLLEAAHVQDQLPALTRLVLPVLGLRSGRIELESVRRAEPHERAYELRAGGRTVGRFFVDRDDHVDEAVLQRVLPGLASVLTVAIERERFGLRAVETESLRRSDAAKTTILRSVSHDLRSPLTAIRAAAEGLDSDVLDLGEHERAGLLETIRIETRRLERLVANLLDLSRLEVGAATPRLELWTADDLVGRALEQIVVDGERVAPSLGDDLPPVRVDAAQIERILVNLLENALKFSRGDVGLSARVEDAELVFRVVDRGEGVVADDRIFSPFDRGSRGSRRGTGLGLAIARGFAEANGGRVWAEATAGGGATFALALPVAAVASALAL